MLQHTNIKKCINCNVVPLYATTCISLVQLALGPFHSLFWSRTGHLERKRLFFINCIELFTIKREKKNCCVWSLQKRFLLCCFRANAKGDWQSYWKEQGPYNGRQEVPPLYWCCDSWSTTFSGYCPTKYSPLCHERHHIQKLCNSKGNN